MQQELKKAIEVIQNGGVLLYPTDTVYGLGCDPFNEKAIEKIIQLKKRSEEKSFIVLVNSKDDIKQLVDHYNEQWFDNIPNDKPTTVIYPSAKKISPTVLAKDGSIAIRIIKHPFCNALLQALKTPLISTSANLSGEPSPSTFSEIKEVILNGVDYVVSLPASQDRVAEPSRLIKLNVDGSMETIRA